VSEPTVWDVAVVGAGPAGLAAAREAARAGARTVVLERAVHPRYKTCGGGLIGGSLAALGPLPEIPIRDRIRAATFTHNGRRRIERRAPAPVLAMARRDELDDALRRAAVDAGAVVRQRTVVRAVEQDAECGYARLADGSRVAARAVIGADGSSGVSARHVGVHFGQVDLGLEVELPVPEPLARSWRGRVLIDWGPLPGSYGWVFPKEDRLTVGVIAGRGQGERTRAYLRAFLLRLGLAGVPAEHDSGHLTRCRDDSAPLRCGRVLVAGDAAGLLEPWTREGISYALRSGAAAGRAAASGDLARYEREITTTLVPEMRAGRRILAAFVRHPGVFHAALATRPGWREFSRFCRGEISFATHADRLPVRLALAALGRGEVGAQRGEVEDFPALGQTAPTPDTEHRTPAPSRHDAC
jgi:geranylgeranyl reductase family protein